MGTSTSGKLLAERLGYEFISGGEMFREYANELGMTLNEFEIHALNDLRHDIELDNRQRQIGETSDDFVLESRLGYFNIPDAFKIKFDCNEDERLRRIAEREGKGIHVVQAETKEREDAIIQRYKDLYGIENFIDNANYDLIVDTAVMPPEEIVEYIILQIESVNKAASN